MRGERLIAKHRRESTLKHVLYGDDFLPMPTHWHASLLCFKREVWIYPLLRASTKHILIVRGLRAGG